MNKSSYIFDFIVVTTPLQQYLMVDAHYGLESPYDKPRFIETTGYGTPKSLLYIDNPQLRSYLEQECTKHCDMARFCQTKNLPGLHDAVWRKLNRYMTYEEFNGISKT